jgi:D-glycero-D-manno-heptose 1,7-bisphosphate phosphatase
MKKRAVFLDRDGNINRDVGYPNSYDIIEIYPYSFEAVRKLNQAGFLAVIITNQSGIGRGLIQEENLLDIHARMQADFEQQRAHIDGVYYCPHYLDSSHPEYGRDCTCRKPRPGMGLQAVRDFGIDPALSYMIGDKVEDIQFGLNLGATPILVLTGYGEKSREKLAVLGIEPAYIAPTLLDAVNWILAKDEKHNTDDQV